MQPHKTHNSHHNNKKEQFMSVEEINAIVNSGNINDILNAIDSVTAEVKVYQQAIKEREDSLSKKHKESPIAEKFKHLKTDLKKVFEELKEDGHKIVQGFEHAIIGAKNAIKEEFEILHEQFELGRHEAIEKSSCQHEYNQHNEHLVGMEAHHHNSHHEHH